MGHTRTILGAIAFGAIALSAQSYDFPATDRNADGVVSREEWNGTLRAFRVKDRNNDGILSGNELPAAWRGPDQMRSRTEMAIMTRREFNSLDSNGDNVLQGREWNGDLATYRALDSNRDGRLTWAEYAGRGSSQVRSRTAELDKNVSGAVEGYEWPYNKQLFHQLDTDQNSVLTENELRNMSRATMRELDSNRNNRLDDNEWRGGFAQMRDLDADGDGRVSSNEYYDKGRDWQRSQRFRQWDKNGDGILQSTEWQGDNNLFHQLDTNGNSQVERSEFLADPGRQLTPRR